MHVKSIVSAIALSAALTLTGPAFAQTMFNGAELSAEDLPLVEQRCLDLVTAASTETISTDTDKADGEEAPDANAGSADAAVTDAPAVNEAGNATSTIDLDTVTLEQCQAAGLGGAK